MRAFPLASVLAALAVLAAAPARADTTPTPTTPASAPRPVVSEVSPQTGPATGGTRVTITGLDLGGATAVTFDGKDAESFSVGGGGTRITAVTPAGTGTVDVLVETPDGTSAANGNARFRYTAAVTGLAPASGSVSGDDLVTITGAALSDATAVFFGKQPAKDFSVDSDTQITATAPEGGGVVDVTVTTPDGTTATGKATKYTYLLAVTATHSGPGGNQVTLDGIGFAVATHVRVGAGFAGFATISDRKMIVLMPPGTAPGQVSVVTPYGATRGIDSGAVPSGTSASAKGKTPDSAFPRSRGDGISGVTGTSGRVAQRIAFARIPRARRAGKNERVTGAARFQLEGVVRLLLVDGSGGAVGRTTVRVTRAGLLPLRIVVPRRRLSPGGTYRLAVLAGAAAAVSKPFRIP